jgi:hypothetical protein
MPTVSLLNRPNKEGHIMSYETEDAKKHYLLEHEGPTHPIHLPLAVRDAHPVKGAPLVLLLALALRAKTSKDFRNCSCFPSYSTLAEDTGLSVKTLKRAAKVLQKLGLVHRDARVKRSNFWNINAIKIWAMARADHAKAVAAQEAWKAEWEAETAAAASYEFDDVALAEAPVDDQPEFVVDVAPLQQPVHSVEPTPATPKLQWLPGGIRAAAIATPAELASPDFTTASDDEEDSDCDEDDDYNQTVAVEELEIGTGGAA